MERFPPPPPCDRCGGSVGLWEAILVGPAYHEPTTWLALSERLEQFPERVLHHVCPGLTGPGDRLDHRDMAVSPGDQSRSG